MKTIVVTRHPALVEYLREKGIVHGKIEVLTHATKEDVRGNIIIGVLPLHLAVEALAVIEIPLTLTEEMRGRELDLETLKRIAGNPRFYSVFEHNNINAAIAWKGNNS